MAVRKRSILALAHLVPGCSSALFCQLIKHLLAELTTSEQPTATTRTYIQCRATISRQGGHQAGETTAYMQVTTTTKLVLASVT